MRDKPADKFSPAETQKRFEAALRGARVAGAKHKATQVKKRKKKPSK